MPAEEVAEPPVRHAAARGHAAFRLLELVAVRRVVEEVGEVRKEIHRVVQQERRRSKRGGPRRTLYVCGDTLPRRVATVGGIDEAEAGDDAARDGALRYLVAGFPVGPIAHSRQRQAVPVVAAAVAQHAVHLPQPRTVVVIQFDCRQHRPVGQLRRRSRERPGPGVAADADTRHRSIEPIEVVDVGSADGREIPLVGEVRPLLELHAAHELGDDKAEVRVALRVRTRWRVHGHTDDGRGEVGSVIEVEAPQVVLVGFPFPAVLADDQSGHRLEDLADAHHGPYFELTSRDRTLAGGRCNPHQAFLRPLNVLDVAKGHRRRDDDFGVQRQDHDDVDDGSVAVGDRGGAPHDSEVEQPVRELDDASRDVLEVVRSARVGHRGHGHAGGHEIDGHARQQHARRLQDLTAHPSDVLRVGERAEGEAHEDGYYTDTYL